MPIIVEPGKTYGVPISVKNQSTKAGVLVPASLKFGISASAEIYNLIPIQEASINFGAGEAKALSYTMRTFYDPYVPAFSGSGKIEAWIKDPLGYTVAKVAEDIIVKSPGVLVSKLSFYALPEGAYVGDFGGVSLGNWKYFRYYTCDDEGCYWVSGRQKEPVGGAGPPFTWNWKDNPMVFPIDKKCEWLEIQTGVEFCVTGFLGAPISGGMVKVIVGMGDGSFYAFDFTYPGQAMLLDLITGKVYWAPPGQGVQPSVYMNIVYEGR